MAKTQTATAIVTSATQTAGTGNFTRGRLDCTAIDGGIVTLRITNGGTGPAAQCEGRILIAHKGSSMPAAASEGTADTDWKQVYVIGGGITASVSTRGVYRFGPEVAYLEVEFNGNTSQNVTVEAHATTFVY